MTLIEFLSYFKIWGPLGLWCGLATFFLIREHRAHHKTRDANIVFAREQSIEFAKALADKDAQHGKVVAELTDRFVSLNEKTLAENRELAGQVRVLLEVVSRKRTR